MLNSKNNNILFSESLIPPSNKIKKMERPRVQYPGPKLKRLKRHQPGYNSVYFIIPASWEDKAERWCVQT